MILTTHKEKLTELAVLSGGSSKLFFWLKKNTVSLGSKIMHGFHLP